MIKPEQIVDLINTPQKDLKGVTYRLCLDDSNYQPEIVLVQIRCCSVRTTQIMEWAAYELKCKRGPRDNIFCALAPVVSTAPSKCSRVVQVDKIITTETVERWELYFCSHTSDLYIVTEIEMLGRNIEELLSSESDILRKLGLELIKERELEEE